MAKKIGDTLRESRIKAGISVEQISSILSQKGYKASIKTIYSWENGNSSPGPDALLEMCDIYKINDILTTFGYNGYREDGSLQPNLNEIELIEKYRDLDNHGKEIVDYILLKEQERSKQLREDHIYNFESNPLLVAESATNYDTKEDPDPSIIQPHTIAAHFDGDELTTDELEEIAEFEKIVKNRKK